MRTAMQCLLAGALAVTNVGVVNAQSDNSQLQYQSAFEDYSSWKPVEGDLDWVGANNSVERIGGWQYYAREPYMKDKGGESAPSMPMNHSMPMDHSMGHDMSKMKKPMNSGEGPQGGHQ